MFIIQATGIFSSALKNINTSFGKRILQPIFYCLSTCFLVVAKHLISYFKINFLKGERLFGNVPLTITWINKGLATGCLQSSEVFYFI